MFEFVACHPVIDCREYCFELEEFRKGSDTFLLAHIYFTYFTPSIFKRVLREWAVFRQTVPGPVYAVCNDGDPHKWERFVSRLGFRPTGIEVDCNNGTRRQLFIAKAAHGQL